MIPREDARLDAPDVPQASAGAECQIAPVADQALVASRPPPEDPPVTLMTPRCGQPRARPSRSASSTHGELPRSASRRVIRILCADDHAFLVEGLSATFKLEGDLDIVGTIPTAAGLVSEVQRLRPNVVLLDINMPGPDPFQAADDARRICPNTRVVFLSAFVKDQYINAALKAGAWGYLCKSDDIAFVVDSIRRVAGGEFVFSPTVAARCTPASCPGSVRRPSATHGGAAPKLYALTRREEEVLRLIGRGLSRSAIARTLSRSPKTIDGHREKIMQKLDIHTNPDLVRYAIREGLAEA